MVYNKILSWYYNKIIKDPSAVLLLFTNIIVIILAIWQNWNLLALLWIYWFQNIEIGFFNVLRILSVKSSSGISSAPSKFFIAGFFTLHYGGFNFGYLIFLIVFTLIGISDSSDISSTIFESAPSVADFSYMILAGGVFFLAHLFSFFKNRNKDRKLENAERLMIYPYARIIPMHLTIIFGILLGGFGVIFFLLLKTAADLVMHVQEHSIEKQ